MMNSKIFFVAVFCLILGGCGYGREDDKEAKRKEDLQALSEEMNQNLTTISSLKVQLRDSLDNLAAGDSAAQARVDKYRLLMAELDKAESSYREWQEEISRDPDNITHEEAMHYYDQQEEKAQVVRMNMRQSIDFVQKELEAPVTGAP